MTIILDQFGDRNIFRQQKRRAITLAFKQFTYYSLLSRSDPTLALLRIGELFAFREYLQGEDYKFHP